MFHSVNSSNMLKASSGASILLAFLLLVSCAKEKITPTTPGQGPSSTSDSNPVSGSAQKMFLVGYVGIDPQLKPAYWTQGAATILSNSRGVAYALSSSDTTKLYSIGFLSTSNKSSLWTNDAQTQIDGVGNDITVLGNDVYIAGSVDADAVFWKNGSKTTLVHGMGIGAQAHRIVVENGNVHVGINVANSDLFTCSTIYWKNGVAQMINPSTVFADLAVVGSDVYILGVSNDTENKAVIWKNGTVLCTFGGRSSSAGKNYLYSPTGMSVQDGYIYVSGIENDFRSVSPCYWKVALSTKVASSPIMLSYDSNPRYVDFTSLSIGAVGSDVYIGGYDDATHKSFLWKNETLVPPFDGSSTTPSFSIQRVCVVKK